MHFTLARYLQRVAACRGEPLTYGLFLDDWLVWCVDADQAKHIEGPWLAWHEKARSG